MESPQQLSTEKQPTTSSKETSENTVDNVEPPVCSFYMAGKCRFGDKCRNLHPESATVIPTPNTAMSKQKRAGQAKKVTKVIEEEDDSKKKPMKTVTDVISRIIWDPSLDRKDFIVGYLDRFQGVIEQYFDTFDWGDIASADYSTLAIPKHRIQYIKYKHHAVWDKTKRIDLVFGSTGCEVSFDDTLREIDNEEINSLKEQCDNIEINTEESSLKPSHFLCVKITNPEVVSKTDAVRNCLGGNDILAQHLLKPSMYHVTVGLSNLSTVAEVSLARRTVLKLKSFFKGRKNNLPEFKFKGIRTVGTRVVFVPAELSEKGQHFLNDLLHFVNSEGVLMETPNQEYHLTILKSNNQSLKDDLNDELLSGLDEEYGCQVISNVHLCRVGSLNPDQAFYESVACVEL